MQQSVEMLIMVHVDSYCDKRHLNFNNYIQTFKNIIIILIADTSIFQLECYAEL